MKTWKTIIENTLQQKKARGWTKLYWCIDLHDTVITGTYNRHNDGSKIFPYAKETLDWLFNQPDHSTILWTSSYTDSANEVCNRFDLKFHYFNVNPECPNTGICDFERKLYFNFLLDDKAGFDPQYDWQEIYETLTNTSVFMSNKQKRFCEDIHGP